MSGIYIHIPFCKQACSYCNFHFATSLRLKEGVLESMRKELKLRMDYLKGTEVETIYFGGGTPSLLSIQEINTLIEDCKQHYHCSSDLEITLEANPDDLSNKYIQLLKSDTPINRLSIGIQSFKEEDLKYMNRSHDVEQAIECLNYIKENNFDNFSLDLIYGVPGCTNEEWLSNMKMAIQFKPKHLSLYALTVEENTPLKKQIDSNKTNAPIDESQIEQFNLSIDFLSENGYNHYEISNYALDGFESKHNSNYWKRKKYIGIGPSAHSFNGKSRSWNIANNQKYQRLVTNEQEFSELETLSDKDIYNEYVLVSIRTRQGIDIKHIQNMGIEFRNHFEQIISPMIQEGYILLDNKQYRLTREGMYIADRLSSDLFI